MAAVTHGVATASTSNASSYASGSFTPAAGDLLVVFVVASGTVAAGSLTDSQSLGFTKIATAVKNSSADTIYLFVANARAAASSMAVTFDCTGDNATGAIIIVERVAGMSRTGAAAAVQTAKQDNQAASGTPAPAFSAAALTGNPTLGCVGNATNAAGLTPPTNWTERADTGYNTPTTGGEVVSRDSGFTGTTITWGSSSASAFGSLIVELDTRNTAAVSQTLGALASTATGAVQVQAAVSQPLENAGLVATGTVQGGAGGIEGVLSQTLADATLSAAGAAQVQADVSQTLGALASTATGAVQVQAALNQNLEALISFTPLGGPASRRTIVFAGERRGGVDTGERLTEVAAGERRSGVDTGERLTEVAAGERRSGVTI